MWLSVDPLAEQAPMHNPYRFAFNNPVFWADPTGLTEETNPVQATCPTCPKTAEFQPFIDDPNNNYIYDPKDKSITVDKEIEIEEVVVVGEVKKKSSSWNSLTYVGFFNER